MLMLRNLVTSLIEHEQIKTTLPKARDTARLVEKMITLGKKATLPSYRRANAFILKPQLVPKVFGTLAQRYADRPGGYTRIHKFGNRPGDNAPHAILELVDNPRDLRFEMTARSVGWEVLGKRVAEKGDAKTLINTGVKDLHHVIETERSMEGGQYGGDLRPKTRWNLQKVLRYRTPAGVAELEKKAEDHIETILAKPVAHKEVVKNKEAKSEKTEDDKVVGLTLKNLKRKAGETMPGGKRSPLHLAQGALGKELTKTSSWFDRRKLGIDRSDFWSRV